MADELPESEYREYFGPEYKLCAFACTDIENLNSLQYLESLKNQLLHNISRCLPLQSVGRCESAGS